MYDLFKEESEPIKISTLIIEEDTISLNPCPCTIKDKALDVHTQFASVEFHWKYKQIVYYGDYAGIVKMNYCPFCGRKL